LCWTQALNDIEKRREQQSQAAHMAK